MSDLRKLLHARCRALAVAAMVKASPVCTHSAMMAAVGLKARASDALADALADLPAHACQVAAVRRKILLGQDRLQSLGTSASVPGDTVRV